MSRTICDIMTSNVITIMPDALLADAYKILKHKRISMLVVEQQGVPVGLLTERDAVRLIHNNTDLIHTTVASVMTSPIMTINKSCVLFDAYSMLTENHFRHLVVVDDEGLLAGVVTLTDMLDGIGLEYFVDLKQVVDIMSKNLIRVRLDDSLRLVVDLMHSHRISCVVVAEARRPVGIITERDVVKYYDHAIEVENIIVRDVMSSPVRTMGDTSYIPEVNKVMHDEKLRHMVIVDHHGRLSGLISQTDLTACMDVGYISYLKGVIEQRENKIRVLRDEHDSFLRGNPNAVIAFDRSGQVMDANPAALRLMANDLDGLMRKKFLALIHADSTAQAESLFKQACQGSALHAELMMHSSSGKLLHVFNSFVPVKNDDQVIRIYAVMHDISDSKRVEQRLHQSEQRFQALLELSRAMPWMLNISTGCFTYVGKQFEDYLGYPVDSWVNMESWASRIHADDRAEVLNRYIRAVEKGESHQFSCRMIASDGRYVAVKTSISVMMQEGEAVELCGFMVLAEGESDATTIA